MKIPLDQINKQHNQNQNQNQKNPETIQELIEKQKKMLSNTYEKFINQVKKDMIISSEIDENKISSKERLKIDKRKQKRNKNLIDRIKDIVFAFLLFLR